ncbi:MAG TPA: very short patch repair endonuclease [Phycisphaerales bacterium]|nr:very short patch repair endonuclease [Phycisphaerales bacterium]
MQRNSSKQKSKKIDLDRRRDPEIVSYTMSRVKSKDSKMEIMLRKELWAAGLKYRKHYKKVVGKPDIAFVGKKVAVFCDSSFWHGLDFEIQKKKLGHNREYWLNKIERNMARDKYVNEKLAEEGWLVIRCSDKEILSDVAKCVERIRKAVEARS